MKKLTTLMLALAMTISIFGASPITAKSADTTNERIISGKISLPKSFIDACTEKNLDGIYIMLNVVQKDFNEMNATSKNPGADFWVKIQANGTPFSIKIPEELINGKYKVVMEIRNATTNNPGILGYRYYIDGKLTDDPNKATIFDISKNDVLNVDFELPLRVVSGTLSLPNGDVAPKDGMYFTICGSLSKIEEGQSKTEYNAMILGDINTYLNYSIAGYHGYPITESEKYLSGVWQIKKINSGSDNLSGIDFQILNIKRIVVTYNGKEIYFDQEPIIENGRTLVPLRAIFEEMGATVEWDNETKTIKATKNNDTLMLQVGKDKAYKNGKEIPLDVPAKVIEGRTLVPVRFIAESMGAVVKWNDITQTVSISPNLSDVISDNTIEPGSCLVLEEKYSKMIKIIDYKNKKIAVAKLPKGTILFSPVSGEYQGGAILITHSNGDMRDFGAYILSDETNNEDFQGKHFSFFYSKENERSNDMSSIEKGEKIGTISDAELENFSGYNLAIDV